ncbi:extensin-like, partial [Penaeus monodon]|uniref:extensin-like n=1 Tax=Penaeus monodon TaxID=6687 RepID=UPI0018A70049
FCCPAHAPQAQRCSQPGSPPNPPTPEEFPGPQDELTPRAQTHGFFLPNPASEMLIGPLFGRATVPPDSGTGWGTPAGPHARPQMQMQMGANRNSRCFWPLPPPEKAQPTPRPSTVPARMKKFASPPLMLPKPTFSLVDHPKPAHSKPIPCKHLMATPGPLPHPSPPGPVSNPRDLCLPSVPTPDQRP